VFRRFVPLEFTPKEQGKRRASGQPAGSVGGGARWRTRGPAQWQRVPMGGNALVVSRRAALAVACRFQVDSEYSTASCPFYF